MVILTNETGLNSLTGMGGSIFCFNLRRLIDAPVWSLGKFSTENLASVVS